MEKIMIDGRQLAYERCGSGTTLLLVHGYPLDHTIWDPLVPLLEKDFDLIRPDLRGFGGSDPSGEAYQLADMAADLAFLLDALGTGQAILAGHSMGGYVALAFAHAYPERLLGLGLVATQAWPDAPERKAARYQEAERILADGVGQVAEGMSVKLTADLKLQAFLKSLILRQPPRALAGALGAMAERQDARPFLSAFDFPVAVVHGGADGLVPVERAREAVQALPKGELTEIESVGHMPMMEAPQRTAEALRKLMA